MRDYEKMRQEGWIPQVQIEQELSQERRAARRYFQLRKAQIMAAAENDCNHAQQEYKHKLERINQVRDEAIRQEEEALNAKLTECAREEDTMRQHLYEMGMYDNHFKKNPQG